jgi:hypothetical protein
MMPEIISRSLDIAKEHGLGPQGAVWIMVFACIAWIAGKSGTGAVKFVRSLLDTSTDLREQIAKELRETRAQQARSEELIRDQQRQIAVQGALIDELRRKLRDADQRADELLEDLRAAKLRAHS